MSDPPSSQRMHAVVRGRVQGVCFRAHTVDEAERLGLVGWVRNRTDRTVEVEAEGEEGALQALLRFLRQGPPSARVDGVDVEWREALGTEREFRYR